MVGGHLWVLGIKLGSSGRTISVLSCGAISPALSFYGGRIWIYAGLCTWLPCLMESRRGHQMPWNWCYRYSLAPTYYVGARNWTWVLFRNNTDSWLLSHLSTTFCLFLKKDLTISLGLFWIHVLKRFLCLSFPNSWAYSHVPDSHMEILCNFLRIANLFSTVSVSFYIPASSMWSSKFS